MHSPARYLDPRHSLASAIGWLIFALSIGLVVVASVWVGDVVRTSLLDQRSRQLDRAAERIAAELNLDLALRLQSVRALAAMLATELRDENQASLRQTLENLQKAVPEFAWIGVASPQGRVLAATQGVAEGASVTSEPWFAHGLKESRRGASRRSLVTTTIPRSAPGGAQAAVVNMVVPVVDADGDTAGVIGTQLSTRWLLDLAGNLRRELRESAGTEALLLDENGVVLIGPSGTIGNHWKSTVESADTAAPRAMLTAPSDGVAGHSRIERLPDGGRYLVAHAKPATSDAWSALGWRIAVFQPLQEATQRAGILQGRITAILLGLGVVAAVLGALLARRLTRDIEAIAHSADALRSGAAQRIAVPRGRNEAALLGRALDALLTSLQRERTALQTLNAELDQRVAARAREIERLAEQARYAAVVRERLKIARDLHDTLAHSMMAMLTEIRLLKRLSAVNPEALAEELTRAEETARQGLQEARAAIAQMRFNPVRDAGLAAALGDLVKLFGERTGIPVNYTSDAPAGAFADERAETMFRIAEEAMRNVERHSGATRASLTLHASPDGGRLTLTIDDDGVGFDADAAHPGHYGLAGLREQARLIGATLTVRSVPQQGTTITVELPLGMES